MDFFGKSDDFFILQTKRTKTHKTRMKESAFHIHRFTPIFFEKFPRSYLSLSRTITLETNIEKMFIQSYNNNKASFMHKNDKIYDEYLIRRK